MKRQPSEWKKIIVSETIDKGLHACMLSCFSHVLLFMTPGTVACEAPLSKEFSRQEYWSLLPYPPPGDLPNPEIEPKAPATPALQANSLQLQNIQAAHTNQYQKHKQPNQKVGKGPKQTFLQRRHTDS